MPYDLPASAQGAPPGECLILALGNPLRGDDGIGHAVLSDLRSRGLPPAVTLLDGGTPGLTTILLMEGYDHVVIIDAADMGLPPGAWRRFNRSAIQGGDLRHIGTLHSAGLAEALQLGDSLGVLPSHLTIFGVQPAAIGWEPGLSGPVQHVVSQVAARIAEEIACFGRSYQSGGSSSR